MGIAVASGLFLLTLLSVDQHWHRVLHEDADEPGHECVLTLLAQGQLGVFPEAPLAAPPPDFTFRSLDASGEYVGVSDLRFPPSCGPPLA